MVTKTGPMARAVASALRALKAAPPDAGAIALAKRYAALIDDATPLAKYRDPLEGVRLALNELAAFDLDSATAGRRHFAKIADALSAHSVASDLGPKLLAALTALGMTPAGRGAKGGTQVGPVASKLDELRNRREQRANRARQHGATDMDAPAP